MKMKMKLSLVAVGVMMSMAVLGASAPAMAAQDSECDRQCLVNLMQRYLAALVKHDPKAVPFSSDVKFVENTANIPVGKGLWVTASAAPTEFQIYAADPVSQQVACLVMMKENNNQNVLLGARLKLDDGKITEAEHLAIRGDDLGANSLANLEKPRPGLLEDVSPADRMPRWQLLKIGRSYYDALTGEDGTLAPMAPECERRENGMVTASSKPPEQRPAQPSQQTAPANPELEKMMKAMSAIPRTCTEQISAGVFAYITDIKNRRVMIADEQKGLAVGFSMFYHDSTLKTAKVKGVRGLETMPSFQGTFNLPAMHIYKVRKGKIYEIEAIGFTLPYGTKSGWE